MHFCGQEITLIGLAIAAVRQGVLAWRLWRGR